MVDPELCPKCGSRLPHDAPAGLCPSCLLAAAFASPVQDPGLDRFHSPTRPGPAGFAPPTPASLAPLFPQLDILDLLGHGGMGAVYKARQKKLDRFVALKIIRPEAAADPAFAERFNREARTLARLSHPQIVAVHDFGEVNADVAGTPVASDPVFYFLMEYVDGANLRQVMDGRRLQPSQVLAIVPQVCEALQFAHDEGVIHRDIKPENILIDSKGKVKIADFGLAKLVAGSTDEFTLTGTHQVMGTPRYMAPEQMEGSHSVDHRADIYSLGVVFYEMLTGQVPAGHFEPPSKKAETDPRLDSIVLRAMAREPERRFQQASDLGTEVELAKSGTSASAAANSFRSSAASASVGTVPALSSFLSQEARAIYRFVAGNTDRTSDHATSPLEDSAVWLHRAAMVLGCSATVTLVLLIGVIDSPFRVVKGDQEFFLTLCAVQVLCFPLAVAACIAASGLRQHRLRTLGIVVSILFLLPLSPAWLITMPVGAYALSVLMRKDVIDSFPKTDGPAESETSTQRPAFSWAAFALGLMLLLSTFGLLLFALVWTNSAWPLWTLFFVWFAIAYCEGDAGKKAFSGEPEIWAVVAVPSTLGLVAYGIYQSDSAWPVWVLFAAFGGAAAGSEAATEDSDEDNGKQPKDVAAEEDRASKVNGQ